MSYPTPTGPPHRRYVMPLLGGKLGRILNTLLGLLKKGKEAGVFDQKQGPNIKPR